MVSQQSKPQVAVRGAKVTTKMIAQHLGIARPTVSTILSGARSNTRVSEELRRRVIDAANSLGYRPNFAAKAVRRGQFGAIGILQAIDSSRGRLAPNALFAIQEESTKVDVHLSMGLVPDQRLTDPSGMPKLLREWCVDGLLISYTAEFPPMMLAHLERHHIPAIWMNVKLDHDCVHLDDFGATAGATEVLLELGHRRIAYYATAAKSKHYSTADRFSGYATRMRQAGLTPRPLFNPDPHRDSLCEPGATLQPLLDLFRGPDRPTAVVTVGRESDVLFAAYQCGLSIPNDLSVITVSEGASLTHGLRCSEMRLHTFGMGYRAFHALRKKIDNPLEPLTPISVFCTFEIGQTLARPAPAS